MAAAIFLLIGFLLFVLVIAIAFFALEGGRHSRATRHLDEPVPDTNQRKGDRGESLVALHHLSQLPPRFYSVFNTLFVPRWDDYTTTTEIDHVVVSPFGLFVIETKAISGWIFGTEQEVNWTVKNHQATYPMRNPLRQNRLHTKSLARFLGLGDDLVHSVVFFVGESTFKKDMPANVLEHDGLNSYICQFQDRVFDEAEFEHLVVRLRTHHDSLDPETARREHLEGLQRRFMEA